MVSVDELNTTLALLRKEYQMTFARSSPFMRQLFDKKKVRNVQGGTHIEEVLMTSGTAQGIAVINGFEVAPIVRRQSTKQLKVQYGEFFAPLAIPGKDMRENQGTQGIVKLTKLYVEANKEAFQQDFNKYNLTGQTDNRIGPSSAYYGFTCLNGQFTSGAAEGTENGLLDFSTPATQSDTVEGVAKSVASGHYNQYADISLWATDGYENLTNAYIAAQAYAVNNGSMMMGPDLIINDQLSYSKFVSSKADSTRITILDARTEGKNSMANTFYNAMVTFDPALDLSIFTGVAADGVWYGINSDFWAMEVLHDFEISNWVDLLAAQDVATSKLIFHGQTICSRLNAQFAISGGSL